MIARGPWRGPLCASASIVCRPGGPEEVGAVNTFRIWLNAALAGALSLAISIPAYARTQGPGSLPVGIPGNATALEGIPEVRLDVTPEGAIRRQLGAEEAARSRLRIQIAGGRFFWASRDGEPLRASSAGAFTYLSSNEPGRYIRFRRLNDRLTYVEHVDTEVGSVTYWGELRIVVGN